MFAGMQEALAQMMASGQLDGASLAQGVQVTMGNGTAFNVRFASAAGGMAAGLGAAGGTAPAPRSTETFQQLVQEYREEAFRNDPLCGADDVTPPAEAEAGWCRGELRKFFEEGGWAPVGARAPTAAERQRVGAEWPVRSLGRPAASLGSALELKERRANAEFVPIADALAERGFVSLAFGASAPEAWTDALSELRRASTSYMSPLSNGLSGEMQTDLRPMAAQTGGQAAWPLLFTLTQALADFGLGLGGALAAHPVLRLRLASYTDAKLSCFSSGAQAVAQIEREDAAAFSDGVERRIDSSDGRAYTRDEFMSYYRDPRKWDAAKVPTGNEDRRKLTAVLFCNPGWKPRHGGESLLLDEGASCWRSVPPEADTLLLFRSDRVLHKVTPSVGPARYAISMSFLGYYE